MAPTAERISMATAPTDIAETNFSPKITRNQQPKQTTEKEKDQGHTTMTKIVKNIKTIKPNTMRQIENNKLTTKDILPNLHTINTKRNQSMNKNVNIVTTMEIVSTLIIGLCSVYQLLNCPMKGTSTNFVEATTCKICVTIKIIAAKYMGFC